MGGQWHGPNFRVLRSHGRAGNAVSGTPVAGCLGGVCILDLPSWWMAGLAAVDSCAIRLAESAGCGGYFFFWGNPGEKKQETNGFFARVALRVCPLSRRFRQEN